MTTVEYRCLSCFRTWTAVKAKPSIEACECGTSVEPIEHADAVSRTQGGFVPAQPGGPFG